MNPRVSRNARIVGGWALLINILAAMFVHPFPGLFGIVASALVLCCCCCTQPIGRARILIASILFLIAATFSGLFALLSILNHFSPSEEFDHSLVEKLKVEFGDNIFILFTCMFGTYAGVLCALGVYYVSVFKAINVQPPLDYVYDPELASRGTGDRPATTAPPTAVANLASRIQQPVQPYAPYASTPPVPAVPMGIRPPRPPAEPPKPPADTAHVVDREARLLDAAFMDDLSDGDTSALLR